MSTQFEDDKQAWLQATVPLMETRPGTPDDTRERLEQRVVEVARERAERLNTEDQIAESLFGPVRKWGRVEFPSPEYRAPEPGRDELAALLHEGPIPAKPRTVGAMYAKSEAYRRADAVIADGWRKP